MKPCKCERESLVIEAVRTGAWDADLRNHVAKCPACSDVALAALSLNEMRAVDEAESHVPDAGLMWWKAQLLAKRAAAERATEPITFVERFAYACGLFCFVGVCVWQWQAIRGWFASLKIASGNRPSLESIWHASYQNAQNFFTGWFDKSASLPKPSMTVILSVGVLLLFVAFAAYFARSEE
ncbi:MAG TPA: hypothetical protein VLY23_01655 [Candidatus Acidoferrum sp.]|nr:hypothetical protein [Candidatus Acidoferrum sp.]